MRLDNMKYYVMTVEHELYSPRTKNVYTSSHPFMVSKNESIKEYARSLNWYIKTKGHLLLNIFNKDLLKFIRIEYPTLFKNLQEDKNDLSVNTNQITNIIIKRILSEETKRKFKFNKFETTVLNIIDYINSEEIIEGAWYKTSCDYNDGLFESNSMRDNFYMFKENVMMLLLNNGRLNKINYKIIPDVKDFGKKEGNINNIPWDGLLNAIIETFFSRIMLFINSPLLMQGCNMYHDRILDNCCGAEEIDSRDIIKNFFAESDVLRYIDFDMFKMRFEVYDDVMNFDKIKIHTKNRFDED